MRNILKCAPKRCGKLFLRPYRHGTDTKTLRIFHIIHLIIQLTGDIALLIEHLLELSYHAQTAVIHDDGENRQPKPCNRIVLAARHLDAAVPRDMNDAAALPKRNLCPECCGKPIPHRPQTARSQPCARLLYAQVKCRPHLVLPHICNIDIGFAHRILRNLMERPWYRQTPDMIIVVIGLLPTANLRPPSSKISLWRLPHEEF